MRRLVAWVKSYWSTPERVVADLSVLLTLFASVVFAMAYMGVARRWFMGPA